MDRELSGGLNKDFLITTVIEVAVFVVLVWMFVQIRDFPQNYCTKVELRDVESDLEYNLRPLRNQVQQIYNYILTQ